MASSQVEESGIQLKHLGFVRIITINAVVLVSNLYDYAKQSSGSLKSKVETVENAVTSVVGPVYQKFRNVPSDLLVFADNKVDEGIEQFDKRAPPSAKKAVAKVQLVVLKVSRTVQDLAEEAKVSGPCAAISHFGGISKQVAVNQFAVVWYKVNQYPALHSVSEMAVPTAAHWSEKYNELIKGLAAKGYSLFSYVPLVPVEEMSKAYKQVEAAKGKKEDGSSSSDSDKE
jgi:hypothetical protein